MPHENDAHVATWAPRSLLALALLALAACGDSGWHKIGAPAAFYTVGGTVAGLTGAGLVLSNNGGDNFFVSGNQAFSFATPVPSGAPYNAAVLRQPTGPNQVCSVTNGTGTIGGGNVTNIEVACATNVYTVGGTVAGLIGTGLVLQDNGGDDLAIAANGPFTFATAVASGQPYAVAIKTQPSSPHQNCVVARGSGTVTTLAVTTVVVNCGEAGLSLVAGQLGGPGNFDGTGSDARFLGIHGVAVDAGGNVYVADTPDQTIRKVTSSGVVTTVAGVAGAVGSADGSTAAARFGNPRDVAFDGAGNLYVADNGNHTIRRITPAGVVTTVAGTAGSAGSLDGTGGAARFRFPAGIATDRTGNVYVADTGNSTIRKVTPLGVVTTIAGTAGTDGSQDGTGSAASFHNPSGLATDTAGNIYVADTGNSTIRKVTPAGAVTTLAGLAGMPGRTDGTASAARFYFPEGVATDPTGNVYVADTANSTIRKIDPAAVVTTLAGAVAGSTDGTGTAASFNLPYSVGVDASSGTIFVADTGNAELRKLTAAAVVTTVAGKRQSRGSQDGNGAAASFSYPMGIAADAAGIIYVADYANQTIRRVTIAGDVTTLAGSATIGGYADGLAGAARFSYPTAVATDAGGNVYVVDAGNLVVRKITPTGLTATLAGMAGVPGYTDGTGSAARFYFDFNGWPSIALDGAGNAFVTDNTTIRRISPTGDVTTFAGAPGPGGSTDGTGNAARFSLRVGGIAVDPAGVLYVADTANYTIRRVTPTGVVTTLAGTAGKQGTTDGTGAAARFNNPIGVAVDRLGTIYVADGDPGYGTNHVIRRITSAGVVTTIIGTLASVGVRLGPLPASLNGPVGVTLLPGTTTTLIISDAVENAILRADLP
jgi:hypothetical protein